MSILPKLNQHFESGVKLYTDNQLYEAVSEFKQIVDGGYTIPGNENNDVHKLIQRSHFQLGHIYKSQNRYKDAITEFNYIYSANENYLNAKLEVAQLYTTLYDDTGSEYYKNNAKSTYESILWSYPDCHIAHYKLAELIRFDEKEIDRTYKEYKTAIRLIPSSLEVRFSFIEFLLEMEEYSEVIKQSKEIISTDKNNAEAHYWLSEALFGKEDVQNAIIEIKQAIDLDGSNPKYHDEYGLILKNVEDIDNAISEFRKAQELKPNIFSYGSHLVDTLVEIGEYDEAIKECNKMKRMQSYEYIYIKCGEIYEKIGQWDDAILEYLEALNKNKDYNKAKEKLKIAKEKLRHINKKGKVYAFSEVEDEFLTDYQLQKKLKNIIENTEKNMRELISGVMENTYGKDWISVLETKHTTIKAIIKSCKDKQDKEYKSYGDCSTDILDFSYPADLFTIIFIEWDVFKSIMSVGSKEKMEKKYWSKHADQIAKLRTPIAHNRSVKLLRHEKILAIAYCEEVNNSISRYK